MTSRKGINRRTVVVVLASLAVLILVLAVLFPLVLGIGRVREIRSRGTCVAHLNAIGKAIGLYMNENHDHPPLVDVDAMYDPTDVAVPSVRTQTDDAFNTGSWGPTLGTNPMQNVWLLIAEDILQEAHFRCPADTAYQARSDTVSHPANYGWVSPFNYSYGMHVPYASGENAAPLDSETPGKLVVLADQVPYSDNGYHIVNSRRDPPLLPSNHPGLGTSILTLTGSVDSLDARDSCYGRNDDEIYANTTSNVVGGIPETDDDTSIAKSGRFESPSAPGTEGGDDGR